MRINSKAKKVIFVLTLFSFLLFSLSSISALTTNLVFNQDENNPILSGNSVSSSYEQRYIGGSGLNFPQGIMHQWSLNEGNITYRNSTNGTNWTQEVNVSFANYITAMSVKAVLNEFGHTNYYQMIVDIAYPQEDRIFIYNSYDGINWTIGCLGNSTLYLPQRSDGIDFSYKYNDYNILFSMSDPPNYMFVYHSNALCSGYSNTKVYTDIKTRHPKILYNSYLDVYSVFYSVAIGDFFNSFSMGQGNSLNNLSNISNYFMNISLEQTYFGYPDIISIYDNNTNFSHKTYFYFSIDNGVGVGVAYNPDNLQLNTILGQENITYNPPEENESETAINGTIFQSWVNSVSGIFPDSESLTSSSRLMYVLIVLLLIDLIIFVVVFFLLKAPKLVAWIVLLFDVLLFFYFLTIGYIPIAILIILLLILVLITFFRMQGGN